MPLRPPPEPLPTLPVELLPLDPPQSAGRLAAAGAWHAGSTSWWRTLLDAPTATIPPPITAKVIFLLRRIARLSVAQA